MAIILRFVNNYGVLIERFFTIKSVSDTTSLNLKKEISNVLVHHDLQVKEIIGQGYDGASNMRGAWNNEIEHMLAIGECDSGSGANQIGNLQRAGAIRWSYHYDSVKRLIAIDFILMELNTLFNESSMELLSLSSALDPKNSFKSINIDDICKLAMKFYPEDFTNQDIIALKYELVHYKLDVIQNLKASTLVELCQQLTESGRSKVYVMLTRLIHLLLTLPVSIATTERAFSTMKNVKIALRNKMEDEFLENCLTLYIERDLAKDIDVDSIIDEFYVSKSYRA
ncbi:uncharacterized protein LOC122053481 [Zingiber officinale]|uniref:uncharacterized protein LOC122053481 n=1 Tax=Zingiber officinale TaxID=94328 RepID=UPI001C4C18A7|nr:uncharacterized protein LOC122053481 [Zingiber officinale]